MTTYSRECVDCHQTFTLSEREQRTYEQLCREKTGFQFPKRCYACIQKKKHEHDTPTPRNGTPLPAMPAVVSPPETPKKEPVSLVLATTDFELLVQGKPVDWRGVHVVLAQIGFDNMRRAIDDAEHAYLLAKGQAIAS